MLTSIHLLILCPAKCIGLYGYNTILAPLINDLKKLESEGFSVVYHGLLLKIFL